MSTRFVVSAVVGVAVGYFAGPQAGFQAFALTYGATAGLDPNKKVAGPRLDDLKIASGAYGAPVAYIEGHPRVAGNIVWCTEKREIATESSQGGKGGPGVDTTLFTYEVDLIIMLAENPGIGVRRIWSNGALIWTAADDSDDTSIDASAETTSWREIRFYDGNPTQLPDPTYEAAVGVGNAPAYRDRSTVVIVGLNLGGSGQFPVLTFETSSEAITTFSGFREKFDDGLGPYTLVDGDMGVFMIVTDPVAGPSLQVIGPETSLVSDTIERDVIVEPFNRFSVKFRLDDIASDAVWDDAPILTLMQSGLESLRFSPAREYTADFLQRATISVGGSGQYFISDSLLTVGVYYQLTLTINDPTDVVVRITTLDGSLIKETALTGFTFPAALDADKLRFFDQPSANPAIKRPTATFDDIVLGSTADRIPLVDVPLDEVVQRQWLRAGLDLAYLDVTDLEDDRVRAMAISQITSPRQVIETLGAAYLFECVESGAMVRMVKRGGAPVVTIPHEDLGATAGDSVEPFPRTRGNELELPAQVSVKFANVDDDYQDGAESSSRLSTGSVIFSNLELPLGMTPTEAKRLAEVSVTDALASIIRWGPVGLTRKHVALEPTDVVLITGKDGSTYRCRILKRTDADGLATVEGVLDDATAIDSEAITSGGYNSSTIVREAPVTRDLLLDIPILRDADDDQGFYWAAQSAGVGNWRGAVLFQSRDDVSFERVSDITDAAIFGVCTTTLPDWTGPRVFDEFGSVTVNVGSGTLSSSTRSDILNDQSVNACAVGIDGRWELLQFKTATLLSAGIYELTGLLRGGRGTEWAMTGHTSGENFVLLRPAGLRRILVDTSVLGESRYYRDVSVGRNLATTYSETFTDNGVGLKPFSPFDIRVARDTSGNATITWQRRSRLSTRSIGALGISVPLGESTEAYSVDVFTDGTYATVKRTIPATAATVSYSAADQTTDFGSPQAVLYIKVYQLAALVGRGYPAQRAA